MLTITKKIPLLNDKDHPYESAVFYMGVYRLLLPSLSVITEIDINNNNITNIDVKNYYSLITVNHTSNVFYMISNISKKRLYKSTINYEEIDSLVLKGIKNTSAINSLAVDNNQSKILILNSSNLYSITYEGNYIKDEISKKVVYKLIGINNDGCYPGIHYENKLTAVGYFCSSKFVAYTCEGSAYIAKISPNGNIISNNYIDDDIVINSIFNVNGNLQLLVTKNDKYNYIYVSNLMCDEDNIEDCNCDNKKVYEIKDRNICGYIEIPNKCEKPTRNPNNDIIESVALIETALSHILNAEGEKIQKILSVSDDPCEILRVNESINSTIRNVTFLEQILYNKLELSKKDLEEDCE